MLSRRNNHADNDGRLGPGSPVAGGRARLRRGRLLLAGLALVAALAVVGCTSGSYPVDIFYEQHYQQSYKSHEPPRLAGVAGAVAYYPPPPNTFTGIGFVSQKSTSKSGSSR